MRCEVLAVRNELLALVVASPQSRTSHGDPHRRASRFFKDAVAALWEAHAL